MPLDVSRPDLSLAVIGTGVMGRGIAQIAAQAGIRVLLHDSRPGAARDAKESVSTQLARLAEKGRLAREAVARAEANLVIADSREALAPCPIVIEAIVENLDAKRGLFRSLEDIVSSDCLMASNTSSFSITAIAAACKRPERIAGFHFFNPVPLMKVVEVVDGLLTAPWVGDARAALRAQAGAREGHSGLHRQPRGPRLRHRGAAHSRGGHRGIPRGRPHPARLRRLPPRPLRAARPDGPRRIAPGDGIDLPAVLRGAALSPFAHHRPARRRRPARTQIGHRLLPLRERQAGRNPRATGAGGKADTCLDQPD